MTDKTLIGQIVAQAAHDYAIPNLIQSDALPQIQDRTNRRPERNDTMNEPTDVNEILTPKPWWESRAVVGSLVAGLASLLALLGWTVDVASTTELLLGLTGLVGSALSWWGSVQRSRPISKAKVLPGLTLGE
jgi:hypothetical protein